MNTRLSLSLLALALVGCPQVPPADPLPAAPRITQFSSSANTVAAGERVTLSWKVENATELRIEDVKLGAVSGVSGNEGSVEVTIADEALYVLTARNSRGASDTAAVAVSVGSSADVRLSALPATINAGEPVTLVWAAPGATTVAVSATPGGPIDLGQAGAVGSLIVRPTQNTVYTLTAGAKTATASVSVRPTILSFSASTLSADAGSTVTLSWVTANASRVQLVAAGGAPLVDETDAGRVASGSVEDTLPVKVDPDQLFTYRLSVSAGDLTVSETLVVTVGDQPAITSFTAPKYWRDPAVGAVDGGVPPTIPLAWATVGASSVALLANGVEFYRAPPESLATGSVAVPSPTADTTYELVATGARGGVSHKSAIVDVVGLPTATLMVSPSTVAAAGDQVTLSWSGSNIRNVRISTPLGQMFSRRDVSDTGTTPAFAFARTTPLELLVDNGVGDVAVATASLTVTAPIVMTLTTGSLRAGQSVDLSSSPPGNAAGFAHRATQVRTASTGFVDITSTGTPLTFATSTDDDVAVFETDFVAPFFDRLVGERVWVSTNGYLSFSPINRRNYSDVTLPSSKLEPYSIALNWDDSSVSAASGSAFWEVRTESDGRRVLIVMWKGVSSRTFEAKLYSNGQLDLEYLTWTGTAGATGVQANGSWGLPLPTAPASNLGITFFAPTSGPLSIDVPLNGRLVGAVEIGSKWVVTDVSIDVVGPNEFFVAEALPSPLPPLDVNAQWVELFNNRSTPLDLSGWTMDVADGGSFVLSGTIAPQQSLVVGASTDATLNDDAGVQLALSGFALPDAGSLLLTRAGPLRASSWANASPGTALVTDVGPYKLSTDTSTTAARALTCAATRPFGVQTPTLQLGTPGEETGCGFPYRLARAEPRFRDISTTGALVPFVDYQTETRLFSLAGAPFPFFGTPQTSVGISTNGYLSFDGTTTTTIFSNPYPSTTDANGLIVPFGDDLEGYWLTSEVFTQRVAANEDPATPAAHWIVQWHHWSHASAADFLDFEVKLFDDGAIEFHYGELIGGDSSQYASGSSAVSWLENPAGTQALVINTNSLTPGITPHTAFRFIPR